MKIAILTQPLHTNYGGLLQAYALQKFLRDRGHDVVTIDRHYAKPPMRNAPIAAAKRFIGALLLGRKAPVLSATLQKGREYVAANTDQFISKHINATEKIFSSQGMVDLGAKGFDAFFVGSDQVWRPKYSPCITNYFFDFLGGKKVKRVAYAASFGVDNFEFDDDTAKQCAALAKKFDAISVREDSAVKICQQHFGVDAVHVVDPTMLLNVDDYVRMIPSKTEGGYVMAYVLDKSLWKQQIVDRVAGILNLPVKEVMPRKQLFKDVRWRDANVDCVYPPVEDWLAGFYNASYVVTDSFHGCVFSILFNKKFVAIGNAGRGLARFNSLLKMFELEDRLICHKDEFSDGIVFKDIDWEGVNNKLSARRNDAFAFIDSIIKSS